MDAGVWRSDLVWNVCVFNSQSFSPSSQVRRCADAVLARLTSDLSVCNGHDDAVDSMYTVHQMANRETSAYFEILLYTCTYLYYYSILCINTTIIVTCWQFIICLPKITQQSKEQWAIMVHSTLYVQWLHAGRVVHAHVISVPWPQTLHWIRVPKDDYKVITTIAYNVSLTNKLVPRSRTFISIS